MMYARLLKTTALLAAVASVSSTPIDSSHPTVEEATQFSLIYGYGLLPYAKWALGTLKDTKMTNKFVHYRRLATADFQNVVRVNVDTLYSSAIIDLSHQDLVVDIPPVEDRYWVFPFTDVYGNNYANLGSVSKSPPGKYLLRYGPDAKAEPGVQLCEKSQDTDKRHMHNEDCDGYKGIVNAPSIYGILLPRFVVKNTGDDVNVIHGLQNKTSLHPVPIKTNSGQGQNSKPDRGPVLTVDMLNSSLSEDKPTRVMQMTARIAPFNPPENITDLHRVNRMLEAAGIRHGSYKPTVQNLTKSADEAKKAVLEASGKDENRMVLRNGWRQLSPAAQGDYHENYLMRAYFDYHGYLGLQATEALYPLYSPPDSDGRNLNLGPKEAYIFTFGSKPPLTETGFWSLTAYNAQQYLIDNQLDRYTLGDRSNLTYADGSLVYGGDSNEDKPFQILVQPADVEPPKNWTSNWLPAPKGGGIMSLTLRLYAPAEDLVSGKWAYPVVSKQDAISV